MIEIHAQIHDHTLAEELLELDLPGVTILTRLTAAGGPAEGFDLFLQFVDKYAYPVFLVWLGKQIGKEEGTKDARERLEELRKIRAAVEKLSD